jgi:uncharacterized protein YbjT (DUF2867 family)
MGMPTTHAVTGPFSYTGKYITARLRSQGVAVRGLVRAVPSGADGVDIRTLQFVDAEQLATDLAGVDVLYNTYWIRFEQDGATFDQAVANSRTLFETAATVGVGRIVHLSVTNPSRDSPFAYFRGKAQVEDALRAIGIPHSIVRPTLVFGDEDILINNIAWLLRRFHAFLMPGNGHYRVQPVFVDDVAELAIQQAGASGDHTLDAAGPDILTFRELLALLANSVGSRAVLMPGPSRVSLWAGMALSRLVNDVTITREELGALMAETLISSEQPTASTRIHDWLSDHASHLGISYTSERRRHWSQAS